MLISITSNCTIVHMTPCTRRFTHQQNISRALKHKVHPLKHLQAVVHSHTVQVSLTSAVVSLRWHIRFTIAGFCRHKVVIKVIIQEAESGSTFRYLIPAFEHHIVEGVGASKQIIGGLWHAIATLHLAQHLTASHACKTST